MTAHVRGEDKDRCLDAGMDDFIPNLSSPTNYRKKIMRFIHLKEELMRLGLVAKNDKA